jgi:hypothetical protein
VRRDGLDLLGESLAIKRHQRIVPRVRGTADRILDYDDAIAAIDRAENRGENAYVGFRAGDDERVSEPGIEVGARPGAEKAESRRFSTVNAGGVNRASSGISSSIVGGRCSVVTSRHRR